MAAVTSVMRVQQILIARLNELLRPRELTFPRYEALMLLHLSRRGSLPLGKMGERLQVHPTSVTSIVDGLEERGYAKRTPHDATGARRSPRSPPRGREVAAAATERAQRERVRDRAAPSPRTSRRSRASSAGLRAEAGDFVD